MTEECRAALIDTFWVETAVQHNGEPVSQLPSAAAGARHVISVENCSGFPADVAVVGELPQAGTGMVFQGLGRKWTQPANRMQRNETRNLECELDLSGCKGGSEPIHAGIDSYVDRDANSRHTPSRPKPLFFTLTIV